MKTLLRHKLLVFIFCLIGFGIAFFAANTLLLKKQKLAEINGAVNLNINLTIAKTQAEKIKGLSGKETLQENEGMLFVYEKEGNYGIWMKDMNFALDIIWMDANFNIVDITENARPESFPEIFYPRAGAQYVLEVNSGFAKKHHIKKDDRLLFKKPFPAK